MRNKQTGFTIIELIVVIALLGILSAVALPRFINITADAHDAAVEGAAAGFATGIALLKAQNVADGTFGSEIGVNFDGEDMVVNASGYAIGASGAAGSMSDTECVEVWEGVLQSGGPVASTATTNVDYSAAEGNRGVDCTYTYEADAGSTTRTIRYESETGEVTVTL